jgi:SAM-dependent methyltransferase
MASPEATVTTGVVERMHSFERTWSDLEPRLRQIVAEVCSIPAEHRPGTAHIDHIGGIAQYAFYVALVRRWLSDPYAEILDWGGQHGQVSLLLSRYYPRATCYVLEGDDYDREYGLADWHRRLGISGIVRATDPVRIVVDRQFDAAISSGVLEHVAECGGDERKSLEELHRILKPNGLLFIWNLPRHYGREYLYGLLGRKAHPRRYRKKEIVSLLRRADFEVVWLSTHEILPLSILKRLTSFAKPEKLMKWDYWLSERLPWLSQNFTVVARRL